MSKNTSKNQPARNQSTSSPVASTVPPTAVVHKNLDDRLQGSTGLGIFSAIMSLLILLVFREHLFGTNVYLFKDIGSDTINIMYPSFYHIADLLSQDGIPGWSFSQGMGQNMYPNSLSDPFSWLLYLIGSGNIAHGIVWVEILKLVMTGIVFFTYLRTISISPTISIVCGLLYTFSGFAIIGSGWYVFSTNSFHLALLLLGFERLYQRNSAWTFMLAWFFIASHNFVLIYLSGGFFAIYALLRYFSDNEFNIKQFGNLFAKVVGYGCVGLAISAVFSIPSLMEMLDSPRVGGEASLSGKLSGSSMFGFADGQYYATLVMRTFSNDLLGTGSEFAGWQNYLEAPMNYCGVICLLLAPQVFATLNKKQKVIFGIAIGFYLLANIMPYFRYAFWLFTGDYFRNLSNYTAFFLVFYTAKALSAINTQTVKPNWILMGGTLIFLLILLNYPYASNLMNNGKVVNVNWQDNVNAGMKSVVVFLLFSFMGLTFLLSKLSTRYIAQIALISVVFLELFYMSNHVVNARSVVSSKEMSEKIGYNDYSKDAANYLKTIDKDFFRIHKNYTSSLAIHGSINDAKVQNFYGTSSYHSFNQSNYIKFLSAMGVVNPKEETETRWAPGLRGEFLLQILCASKYWFFKGDWKQDPYLANTHELVGTSGDVNILKSKLALPLGFLYDKYISESAFSKLDKVKKQIAMLRAVMVSDEKIASLTLTGGLEPLNIDSIPPQEQYSFEKLAVDTDMRKKNVVAWSLFSNNLLKGNVVSPTSKTILFLSIPFDKGWSAKIDHKDTPIHIVDGGLMGIPIEAGAHEIELSFTPPLRKTGMYISIFGVLAFLGIVASSMFVKRATI
jgi:uncharacterized membrane protein YfhO